MAQSIRTCKRCGNISGRGLAVAVDTLSSYEGIKGFKSFCSKKRHRAETTNMFGEMKKDMKFWFVEPLCCPESGAREEVIDGFLKEALKKYQ